MYNSVFGRVVNATLDRWGGGPANNTHTKINKYKQTSAIVRPMAEIKI